MVRTDTNEESEEAGIGDFAGLGKRVESIANTGIGLPEKSRKHRFPEMAISRRAGERIGMSVVVVEFSLWRCPANAKSSLDGMGRSSS